jgi:hypothetical protein
MGRDIHGFIELRDDYLDEDTGHVVWHSVGALDCFYAGRSYSAFECLFGGAGKRCGWFEPLAGERGFPEDASRATARDFQEWGPDAHSPSWITWTELEAAQWDEQGAARSLSILEYRRAPGGDWVCAGIGPTERLAELTGTKVHDAAANVGWVWPEGSEWRDGDRLFRIARPTRRDVVRDKDWGDVWTVMRILARRHRPQDVRLVVWFDN